MKKCLCSLAAVVLLILCVAPAFAANIKGINPGDTLYVKTSGTKLNVREAPAADAARLFKLDNGTAVIAGSDYQNGYLYIYTDAKKTKGGYVDIRYLAVTKSGGSATPAPSAAKETVESLNFKTYKLVEEAMTYIIAAKPSRAGGYVNLRWVPSTEGAVIARMYAGEELTVITEGKTWYQVKNADGYVGFVLKKYTDTVFYGATDAYEAMQNPVVACE